MAESKPKSKGNPEAQALHEETFGQIISHACESYKTLEKLISGEAKIEPDDITGSTQNTVRRALAKDFLFLVNQIYRLCKRHRNALPDSIPARAIDNFLNDASAVKGVRDILEHGVEPDARLASRPTPKLQRHEIPGVLKVAFYTDERWLCIRDRVPFMGEINLKQLNSAVESLRKIAGYYEVLARRAIQPEQ